MPVSTYLQLVPRVQTGLSTFPAPLLVVDKLQETAREFARETLALREDFDIDLSEGVRNYRLASADGLVVHKVAAVFRRSLYDIVNGRDGEPLNPAQFALMREREIDDGLVVTTSQDGYADEGVYSLTGETLNDLPVFASAGGDNVLFCGFNAGGTGIVYYIASAEDYAAAQDGAIPHDAYELPPPYSAQVGTYNGKNGFIGTATVAANAAESAISLYNVPTADFDNGLRVRCAMVPEHYSTGLPARYMDSFSDALISGARAKLLLMKGRPWSDPEMGAFELRKHGRLATDAKWTQHDGEKIVMHRLGDRGNGAFF